MFRRPLWSFQGTESRQHVLMSVKENEHKRPHKKGKGLRGGEVKDL